MKGPQDMPPELADFELAAWVEPCPARCGCSPAWSHGYLAAHARWSAARVAWCKANDVRLLDVLRERYWIGDGDDAS